MRLFLAVWPPLAAARALADWAHVLPGKPVPVDKIHLTLAFLGEADPGRAAAAAQRVQVDAHRLPIETARYWKHNRIVWAGPRACPPELAALVDGLHRELLRAQFILERRRFAAHVTLVRKAPPPRALAPLPGLDWPVREFALVCSRTSPAGSSYDILERFPLLGHRLSSGP